MISEKDLQLRCAFQGIFYGVLNNTRTILSGGFFYQSRFESIMTYEFCRLKIRGKNEIAYAGF